MAGYSEIINVIGAMIIFSVILLSANSMIMRNSMMQVEGELEQEVIALGQEIIEEALSKSFDRVTVGAAAPPTDIPGGFTPASEFENTKTRSDFTAFEDYHGWSGTVETSQGTFELFSEVFYVDDVNFQYSTQPTTFKKIVVTITSIYLTNRSGDLIEYKLEFIRNYYAD